VGTALQAALTVVGMPLAFFAVTRTAGASAKQVSSSVAKWSNASSVVPAGGAGSGATVVVAGVICTEAEPLPSSSAEGLVSDTPWPVNSTRTSSNTRSAPKRLAVKTVVTGSNLAGSRPASFKMFSIAARILAATSSSLALVTAVLETPAAANSSGLPLGASKAAIALVSGVTLAVPVLPAAGLSASIEVNVSCVSPTCKEAVMTKGAVRLVTSNE
jgi:hypothetical protein